MEKIDFIRSELKNFDLELITWGYPEWQIGALVTYVNNNNREYLRTVPNATQKDNLDNAINMKPIRN
ncbi:DUF3892 domain-containing protein [Tenacibaculum ovolyticum]|uniref:DUF3892 domain-containing protein n=1 Tax=Tenacibaculum ovolyticum TaxID=104270 RepID=UPI003BA98853